MIGLVIARLDAGTDSYLITLPHLRLFGLLTMFWPRLTWERTVAQEKGDGLEREEKGFLQEDRRPGQKGFMR